MLSSPCRPPLDMAQPENATCARRYPYHRVSRLELYSDRVGFGLCVVGVASSANRDLSYVLLRPGW
jgi:hypothetical protein